MTATRKTRQRQAIVRALAAAKGPLGPDEIHERARRDVPNLGIATVYRTVRALEEEGWLRRVDLPGAATRFETAARAHHHHFHCRVCDRVLDVRGCPDGIEQLVPPGFRLEAHEITLYGVCETCPG